MIFFARATRGLRMMRRSRQIVLLARGTEEGMEADYLLCSRNARSSLDSARDPEPVEGRTPLVGRAQWKITQPPSLE